MAWTDYIDDYCERTEPGLLAEPLNALSNVAFLVAALALWLAVRRTAPARPGSLYALAVLLALIGLGSGAFHTVATGWAQFLDVFFIAVFIHVYVVCFLHWFYGVRWTPAWLGAPAFAAFNALMGMITGGEGSASYLPALIGLAAFTIALSASRDRALVRYRIWFGAATATFALSLLLRSVDLSVCPTFTPGTHFLWHTLNACVLYLVGRAAVVRAREV
ncbi:ceramidase domain-containing protein [Allokutzneria albata]|uniref:Ceramidase n=1 Tax=Allokutzneria albata TaxID=211114 RepID=A0A1H0B1H8_ALLAB|nr:ceramidase domain-containing protein [Allokutzneria albata]SDN39436.1 Ceramidase [Allokutzneria albata]